MKKNHSYLKLFGAVLLTLSLCFVFHTYSEAATPIDGHLSVIYNSDNGLPTSEANSIAQTSDGFIWIGSYGGLVRYDGTSFETFDPVNGVPGVVSLFVDSKDRLWIGTNDNGVAMFSNEKFTSYSDSEALSSHCIRAISEDADGNIIIATTSGMGYIDKKNKLHALNETQVNNEYISMLSADKNGVVYGITETGSIFSLENLRITNFYDVNSSGFGAASAITPDPENDGYVYIATEDKKILHTSLANGMSEKTELSTGEVGDLNYILPVDDILYICSDSGIGYFDRSGNFTMFSDLALNNSVDYAIADSEKNLWFASSRQGLMKVVPNDFKDINSIAGCGNKVVNTTCLSGDLLYAGCDDGLLALDSSYHLVENELTSMLSGIRVRCIKKGPDGTLYISTYSEYGLVIVDKDGNISTISENEGLASNKVRTSLILDNGDIAVASNGGVNIISDGVVSDFLDAKKGVKNSEILCLAKKSDGTLLMGSDGDGIYATKDSNTKRYGRSDGLSSEVVMRIVEDPVEKDCFWIVTSNMIDFMDAEGNIKTIEKFPFADNFDIYFDKDDNLWILSATGLYVANRESLLGDKEAEYMFYDGRCGLHTTATANSYSAISEDDIMYIAGSSGIVGLDMQKLSSIDDVLQLAIPFVEADDKIYTPDKNGVINLPHSVKRVTIHAHAITYSLKNPKVNYILEGFDDEAITTTRQDLTPIVYTNLDGGKYEFTLTSLASDENEPNMTTITINKKLAFYEIPIVKLLGVALVAGFIGFLVWYRLHRRNVALERQSEQRHAVINQTVHAFAKAIDFKDRYTNGHSFRVANYTRLIAQNMDYSDLEIEHMYNIALLHDIGKLAIPDSILNKPEALNDEEYAIMKSHAQNGYDILSEIKSDPDLAIGAGFHHERIDGKGYPNGVTSEDIPMVAQIIAVADTFDAMYSTRPYRKKLELSVVLDEIKKISGTQLNPDIVKVFVKLCENGQIQ